MSKEKICDICSGECYRQTYRVGEGWSWRHEKCEPLKYSRERQYARGHIPMAYVPANYWISKADKLGKV